MVVSAAAVAACWYFLLATAAAAAAAAAVGSSIPGIPPRPSRGMGFRPIVVAADRPMGIALSVWWAVGAARETIAVGGCGCGACVAAPGGVAPPPSVGAVD